MQYLQIGYSVLLLVVANGAPVIAADLFKNRWKSPIDGGNLFLDGRPWLGHSKTWRGICASFLATSLVAELLGIGWKGGLVFASLAMAGDLMASFSKRRMKIVESGRAWFLDQLPESLLPALLLSQSLGLSVAEAAIAVTIFTLLDIVVSPLLYRLHIRRRPY